MYSERVLFV